MPPSIGRAKCVPSSRANRTGAPLAALALRQETYRPDPIRREIAAPIAGFCERSLAMRGDRSLARGIAFEGMSVEAVRAARQDRRGSVEGPETFRRASTPLPC
jgi:hypothetical protein